VADVLAGGIVEHLDVVEHILSGFTPRSIGPASDAFALEQVEEALSHGIIVAVSAPAHGVNQIVVSQEASPVHAGELGALVRMDQHRFLWLAAPDRHVKSLQDNLAGLPALQ